MSNDNPTPAEEVNNTEEEVVETQEETIASAMEEKKTPDQIPYNRFQEKVNENKELKERIGELEQAAQADNMSKEEVASDLEDIASEFNLDAKVLDKVADKLASKAQQTIDEKLAPLTAREQKAQQDRVLGQMLDKALESNPDFKDVVNPDVIKQLALNPDNANKTMTQLVQDTYGSAVKVTDKKTMESTTPGKSEAITSVDYDRAQTDSEYFAKIKADPALKAEYNQKMTEQLSRYM